jgi:hypothetical protein
MTAKQNYPPGVSASHPIFNPPTCDKCGEVAEPGEDCSGCGEYVPTDEDAADAAFDAAYDRARDRGDI